MESNFKNADNLEANLETTEKKQNDARNRKNNNSTFYLVIILLIVILLMQLRTCKGDTPNPGPLPTQGVTVVPDGPTLFPNEEDGPVEGSGYINEGEEYDPEAVKEALNAAQNQCSINASNYLAFANKNAEGELKLKNKNDFYIQVSIMPYDNDVADMNHTYFTSIVIGPGEEMNKIKLTKNLDKLREGSQPCLLYYDCFAEKEPGAYEKEGNTGLKRIGTCGLKITVNMLSVE